MKSFLFFSCFFLSFINSFAQSVPNGNFESWTNSPFEEPLNTIESSNPESFLRCSVQYNCEKTTDAFHGNFAVKLSTRANMGDTCAGYFLNANANSGNPSNWVGGIPYNQSPTGIKGFYKSTIASGDSGLILLSFKSGGSSIGFYVFKFSGNHNSYTPFNFTLNPPLPMNPDTVIFGATSSDFIGNTQLPGSVLQLDSISFTGVTSQPTLFNGDFENWQTKTISKPDYWNLSSDNIALKTSDAYDGVSAVELITSSREDNGTFYANPGRIGTNRWDPTCSCDVGGYPFTNAIDTLVFHYKYLPSISTDSAQVYIYFKKNGNQIWGNSIDLRSSPTYQLMEIPFNVFQNPDSVVIQFNSSTWSHSSSIYAGSNLKVDGVHFKSQPLTTGIEGLKIPNIFSFYPNPSNSGVFNILSTEIFTDVEIINVLGEKVCIFNANSIENEIDMRKQPKGIYLYKIRNSDKILATGKIKIE